GGTIQPSTAGMAADGAFETVLRNALLNYNSARAWRMRPAPQAPLGTLRMSGQGPSYKISVQEDGLYRLTYADLQSAGLAVDDLDPRTCKLHRRGDEVAIRVTGEEDGSFDPSDAIEFYGQAASTPYTDTNVYWLTTDGAAGLRMAEVDGLGSGDVPASFLDTLHLEQDRLYRSHLPMLEGADHWYWHYLPDANDADGNGDAYSAPYPFTLRNISGEALTATLCVHLMGFSYGEHYTRVYVNGHLVEDAHWSGRAEQVSDISFPQAYLREGDNVITVEVPNDLRGETDYVFVNEFGLDYYRAYIAEDDALTFSGEGPGTWQYEVASFTSSAIEAFDITDPVNVSRIINATIVPGDGSYTLKFRDTIASRRRYLALISEQVKGPVGIVADNPSDLKAAANGADYLIITHGNFYQDVLPLASYRAAQGLRARVIDVQDIYDEFSYGLFDPHAIRDFLAYAYTNWQPPAPSYVLLVGDGTFDFKDNLGTGEGNYIPPYLALVDPWLGETASDNRYVTISGDDILPDMFIGRLSANTAADTRAMVDKILRYEESPPKGPWNRQVLFVADNADSAGDFAAMSDEVIQGHLPLSYKAQKVYYQVNYPTSEETRAAIIGALNEGQLLVNYIGHASIQQWAHEDLFGVADIASLANGDKLPMMLPMTCYDGYFHYPGYPSLGESLVRAEDKGAIASWSPVGLGVATGHEYLDRGFFDAVFADGVKEIGPATTQAKLYLFASTNGYRDLIDTYLLFGDPAMGLNLASFTRFKVYLPIIRKGS
ncbi:MAG: hypothetical protein H8E35_13115, partial [Ardenticatenia bacterium]|nr:hypothetical protein [Ardenticatenia bacterium]